MSKIRIKNFGPIKEGYNSDDGFMDIKKVTVFIGEQGSGKSTVAKLFSTFSWLEKALYRSGFAYTNDFPNICQYQGIKNYFRENTHIEYKGEVFEFSYLDKNFSKNETDFKKRNLVPKIMYVPAERNFLSAVEDVDKINNLPQPLITFLDEFKRAQRELSTEVNLPIRNIKFQYNGNYGVAYIVGADYKINLLEASSGIQSIVPLFLVSRHLALSINKEKDRSRNNLNLIQGMQLQEEIAKILLNDKLSEDLKQAALEIISSKYQNSCFINIVEEPEQNLFPSSQRQILNSLIEFADTNHGNKLIMTTHSPYLINYLSIAIQGRALLDKIKAAKRDDLLPRLFEIVPEKSCISSDDVVIYQLQEDGSINRLPDYEGIPSDKNYLNQSLAEGNQLFGSLLEIEEEL